MFPRFILLVLFFSGGVQAQAPNVAWQKLVGGSSYDLLRNLMVTPDGGYFVTGWSTSNISGDKTEDAFNSNDYWVVKLDSDRNIEWQRTLGGAPFDEAVPGYDYQTAACLTADGGYLVGGSSASGISGNKTEACRGYFDYWIVKLDANGITQWQKAYGGTDSDELFDLIQTSDGGYILAGYSVSPISGEKTENSRGGQDFWIIKINAEGDITWQKTLGGSGIDSARSIIETSDGGYVVGGTSNSSISGEKTENSYGGSDYWILKLDSLGGIQWQKTIGGSGYDNLDQIILTDSGYFAIGSSTSGISGLKTEINRGIADYWVVKLDVSGAIEWQRTLGGDGEDSPHSALQCPDGGFMIAGSSASGLSGDKTENSYGDYDSWIIRLDGTGGLLWQKAIGGSGQDGHNNLLQMPDGSYILGGGSASSNSGTVTETGHGDPDYWILKLNPEQLSLPQHAFAEVSVYPNPTAGQVTLSFGGFQEKVTVGLTNILGQRVCQRDYEHVSEVRDFPVTGAQGIYLLSVKNAAGEQAVFKIIKE